MPGTGSIRLSREVINASAWLRHHPGGALAILHFVGRDASNEVDAYHSPEAIKRLERFASAPYKLTTSWAGPR